MDNVNKTKQPVKTTEPHNMSPITRSIVRNTELKFQAHATDILTFQFPVSIVVLTDQ